MRRRAEQPTRASSLPPERWEVRLSTTLHEREAAFALRRAVFINEQGVPAELEQDETDGHAIHVVGLAGGSVVATGRLVPLSNDEGRIGRMAVAGDFRRQGLGSLILTCLEQEAQRRGIRRLTLHAQLYVERFYAERGYSPMGAPFLEAGIHHIQMMKQQEEP